VFLLVKKVVKIGQKSGKKAAINIEDLNDKYRRSFVIWAHY